jgi:SNF2 family DNA or RNA helicase
MQQKQSTPSNEPRSSSLLDFLLKEPEFYHANENAGHGEPVLASGFRLLTQLRPHQLHAVRWMLGKEQRPSLGCRGGFLWDDSGLGKTLVLLTLALHQPTTQSGAGSGGGGATKTTLIVVPPHLLQMYRQELQQHFSFDGNNGSSTSTEKEEEEEEEEQQQQKKEDAEIERRGTKRKRGNRHAPAPTASRTRTAESHVFLCEPLSSSFSSSSSYSGSSARLMLPSFYRTIKDREAALRRFLRDESHHSKSRERRSTRRSLSDAPDPHLPPPDQVKLLLCSYNYVSQQWDAASGRWRTSSVFARHQFDRVILDEAHLIRSHNSPRTQACLALRGSVFWAVTATPIFNRLDDLFPLLSFVGVSEFVDNYKQWNSSIVREFATDPVLARTKLKSILIPITLRRGKEVIELPPLQEKIVWVDLKAEQRDFYDNLFSYAQGRVDGLLRWVQLYRGQKDRLSATASSADAIEKERRCAEAMRAAERALTPSRIDIFGAGSAAAAAALASAGPGGHPQHRSRIIQPRLVYSFILNMMLRLRQACNSPWLAMAGVAALTAADQREKSLLPRSKAAMSDDPLQRLRQIRNAMERIRSTLTTTTASSSFPFSNSSSSTSSTGDPLQKNQDHPLKNTVSGDSSSTTEDCCPICCIDYYPSVPPSPPPPVSGRSANPEDQDLRCFVAAPCSHSCCLGCWKKSLDLLSPRSYSSSSTGSSTSTLGASSAKSAPSCFMCRQPVEWMCERSEYLAWLQCCGDLLEQEQEKKGDKPANNLFSSTTTTSTSTSTSTNTSMLHEKSNNNSGNNSSSATQKKAEIREDEELARRCFDSSKIQYLIAEIETLFADSARAQEAVLVFSQWTEMLDLVSACLRVRGIAHFQLDGSQSTTKRAALVEQFQRGENLSLGTSFSTTTTSSSSSSASSSSAVPFSAPKDEEKNVRVCLMTMSCISDGVTITRASHVYVLDEWWNSARTWQSTQRAYRLGQTRPVTVTRLLARDSIELAVSEMCIRKSKICAMALTDRRMDRQEKMDWVNDVRLMFSLSSSSSNSNNNNILMPSLNVTNNTTSNSATNYTRNHSSRPNNFQTYRPLPLHPSTQRLSFLLPLRLLPLGQGGARSAARNQPLPVSIDDSDSAEQEQDSEQEDDIIIID